MKIAVLLSRHRRLLALCGLSAAAHLLVLELAAQRAGAPASAPRSGEALRLRLVPAAPAPRAALVETARPAAVARTTVSAPGTKPAPRPVPAAVAVPPTPAPSSAPSSAPAQAQAAADAGTPLIQMPSRYRVRMPDAVRLSYALTRQAPGAQPAPAGDAAIDWRSDGEHYTLTVDGAPGRLRSEGGSSDAGIAPRSAAEERDGASLVTDFDADAGRILFRASGASVPDAVGAQDRASVLMQLAGIGLAEPEQIGGQVGNEIRIVVAGADGAEIARYQVMGQEDVATALGTLAAWRLAQVVPAGQARLELWLAPDRGWLPVQLRMVRPDGGSLTQTLTRIDSH